MAPVGAAPSIEGGGAVSATTVVAGATGGLSLSRPDEGSELEETTAERWEQDQEAVGDLPAAVLVVDDDPRNLLALEETLRGPGCEVLLARSGADALKHLLVRDVAVILMDVHMPEMDGYETAEMIRTRERCRHIPIIFVTAVNKDETHVFRGYSTGAVDYVFKPIDPLILRSKVSVFVELYRKTEEVKRQAEQEKRLLQENFRVRAEKLHSEQALRRNEEQQSLIVRSLPIALYTVPVPNAGRAARFVSDTVERITGFPAARFAEDPAFWQERIADEDRDRVLHELDAVHETGGATMEYRWRCADGSERYFLDQAVLVRDRAGRPGEIFGTWLDITERKHLEQQLMHAQKLEAVGKLTGGIAHDFNNMLSVVIGNLDLLEKQLKGNKAAARFAKTALDGALRCADLTQRLLTFSRRQPLRSKRVDLNELVSAMTELLRRTLGDRIEIVFTAPDGGLWPVMIDPTQIESALVNLALNARDAMPDGGRLAIEMRNLDLPEASPETGLAAGSYVTIAVADTGSGIPQEVLPRVFEPFFTTKEIGQGTGLGLSTTYGFIKQSGGHIAIDSEIGRGTTVTIYLPRSPEDAGAATDAGSANAARADADGGGPQPDAMLSYRAAEGEAVLIVEDDPDVREIAVATFEEMGFRVLQAANAKAALDLIGNTAETDQLRLLFTDIVMPGGMSGRDLAREARLRRADLKVLFASGYGGGAGPDAENAGAGEDEEEMLQKPYRRRDLAVRVGALLTGAPQPAAAAN
jgi:PAS domain S-box-containing protein